MLTQKLIVPFTPNPIKRGRAFASLWWRDFVMNRMICESPFGSRHFVRLPRHVVSVSFKQQKDERTHNSQKWVYLFRIAIRKGNYVMKNPKNVCVFFQNDFLLRYLNLQTRLLLRSRMRVLTEREGQEGKGLFQKNFNYSLIFAKFTKSYGGMMVKWFFAITRRWY